jgi:hypothetical protein
MTKPLAVILTCALALSGCGKGKKGVPGLENFHAGVLQKNLYVSFVATTLQWDQGITVPIPGLDDATLSVAPDLQSSGTVFQFSIGLEALLGGGKPLPVSGLPDGRALPDVQGGALPRWDADVRGLKLSLYLSDDAFAIFVPLGIKPPWLVSVRIEDERGNLLGKAYAIPSNVGGSGSGLFILLPYLGGPA